jgi:hypothetical protein
VDIVLCSEQVDRGLVNVSRGLRDCAPAVQQTLFNGLAVAMHSMLDTLPTKGASSLPGAAQVLVAYTPSHCLVVQPHNAKHALCERFVHATMWHPYNATMMPCLS